MLDIPVYTARDWHRSFLIGTFRAERGARQQSYTPEQKALVLKLRKEQGLSYNQISQQTKVNRATVLQWIHRENDRLAQQNEEEDFTANDESFFKESGRAQARR